MKQHIHFVGIKGVGIAPLAIIAKQAGFVVTGSDIEDIFITDIALTKSGITPSVGFSSEHVGDASLVITTGAHEGFDNPEVQYAKVKGIQVMTQGEAVGVFMKGQIFGRSLQGISVAGSHGKTTTTAMLATILTAAKLDPSYVVGTGGIVPVGLPGHYGKGSYFIAEADEYATEPKNDKTPKFLWQHPKIAVFTNIELDHPDLYTSVDDVRQAFLKFANQLGDDGLVVSCGDDFQVRELIKQFKGKVITYGFSPRNDYRITRVSPSGTSNFFWVETSDISLGEFRISVPGEHNVLNALSALIVASELGLPLESIRRVLPIFLGSKRRLEQVGTLLSGALLYDDYAHHPTEIQKSLSALKKSFPRHKIISIFQPHTFSRTKKLFTEFGRAFTDADIVAISDIYSSLREPFDETISSKDLVEEIEKTGKKTVYLPKLQDVVEYIIQQNFGEDAVVVTMGAGDIYKVSLNLKFKK